MHKDRIILCGVEIQHGFQHLIIHFNELECLVHALFILTGYDGHHISHKADVAIDEQTVVGTGLRVGLAGLRVTAGILRHILPSEDGFDAGHFLATVVLMVRTMAFAWGERSSLTIRQSCGMISSI